VASPSLPAPQYTLAADDARLLTLYAQGLIGTGARRGGVPAMLRRLGAVQLDTISVLARSHELVAYARLGAISRSRIERAYWSPGDATTFEYWSHAACILPVEEWPYYGFRRRAFRARGMRWHQVPEQACGEILARLRAEGPLTATDLGGAKRGGEWWDWSDTKIAVEWLLDTGEVVCTRRAGWRRVYDLPERALPASLLSAEPDDADCAIHLAGVAGRALGVVTRADLVDYQRMRVYGQGGAAGHLSAEEAALAAGLVPVSIEAPPPARGRSDARTPPLRAWADPALLASTAEPGGPEPGLPAQASAAPASPEPGGAASAEPDAARRTGPAVDVQHAGRHRVTLLSPFDSLVWDRKRTLRMFGFEHSLEAYVPRHKRVHGYFAMPLLAGGRLMGRVDPARDGKTLVAQRLSLESVTAAPAMARALREAAGWVGCDHVVIEAIQPSRAEARMRAALADVL
jgi:uncharacterized protein YcaQ